jgi:hypothetical protein
VVERVRVLEGLAGWVEGDGMMVGIDCLNGGDRRLSRQLQGGSSEGCRWRSSMLAWGPGSDKLEGAVMGLVMVS